MLPYTMDFLIENSCLKMGFGVYSVSGTLSS